jgi:hypothetical protein
MFLDWLCPSQRDNGAFKLRLQTVAKREAEEVSESNREKYKRLFSSTEQILLDAAKRRQTSCVVEMEVPEGYQNPALFLQGFCDWCKEYREMRAVVREGNKVEFSWE